MHNNTPRRQRNYHTKLNETQVLEIRALHAQGYYSQREIAEMFGVDHVTILHIVNYKTWKHVK